METICHNRDRNRDSDNNNNFCIDHRNLKEILSFFMFNKKKYFWQKLKIYFKRKRIKFFFVTYIPIFYLKKIY